MAQLNYFIGLKRGFDNNVENVVAGTPSAMTVFSEFINGGGSAGAGANLPVL